MSNEEASSSQGTKRPKRRKVDCSGYCGLTEEEVNSILSLVDEDIYLSDVSEEDPFLDSGSEYCPSSEDSESDLDELEPENEQENQQEEVGNVEDNITHQTVLEIIWTKNEFLPKIHEFDTTNSGVKDQNLDENSKEVDYFLSLFTENIVDVILDETNNYACQQNAKNWKHLERSEFYVFLALTLLMPRNKKVNLKEYWSQNHLLLSPAFSKHMSRDRYFQLQRYLHFSNNEIAPPGNRLFKVENVLNILKENFQSQFYPFQNLVIDESMILFKGRLSFKQYIKTKKHRFGIKLYLLCDCETGIVLDFIIYCGKDTNIKAEDKNNLGTTGAVVAKLLEPYLNKGHPLYTDNFYTSPTLSTFLLQHKTNSCGTVRQNRQHMPVFAKKLKQGDTDWRSSENLLAIKWKDRRDVVMLTSMHENRMVTLPKINRSTYENVIKPLCVLEYNRQMGAVDRSDMMLSSVDCTRKCLKWYKKLFFHSIDITLLNAHAMFSTRHTKKTSFANFHLAVIAQLIERYGIVKSIHCDLGNARLQNRHFPVSVPRKPGSTKVGSRRCWVCSHTKQKQAKRKESSYMCPECDVGLCVVPCFKIYHTEATF
ncbi:unnamed protein product [Acanthoscelides obtectus]|uniref:PiggyBac transposable element-derived protein 4-like n=1 Tax=Acanthoscelides obtectus TaxID=200917 RepID=A0A9P0P9U2_ACAOB|nr:unnamed protein product [Acanthoscelides obtectus]CAK1656672.1 PiggyBac transposable element-derived protein 4 [Acanthoscelides obtectus]